MKPILRARLIASDSRSVRLDCGDGAEIRIVALAEDLVRVTLLRGGQLRQKRTWAVPAFGREDTDWAGRDRLDDSSWPAVAIEITASSTQVALATRALRLSVTLDGFRMDWGLPDGTIFARDRETQPYFLGQKTHAFKHAMARAPGDRHYGLGDKTGPLDLTGRRLRCAMRDSLGFDPERGDPLYKNWPFLIVRDAASGVSHGLFYDNGAEGAFDLGCEHDNYFGRYRAYEAEDGDLDFYLILGPRLADVTAKFVALTGRTALPPRWSLGFAQTAMALADAPDAEARIEGVIFTWSREKFPQPKALTRAFADAGMKVVANVKPCLLDDHPRYAEVAAAGGFIAGRDDHAPLKSQFWDGEGAHVDFTNPAGVAWWRAGLTHQVLHYGVDAGWNDNNEYGLWDDNAVCTGFGEPTPLALLRPIQALLMTRATRES
jgi:alpha-glucosidase